MAKFQLKELIGVEPITVRLGAGTGSANYFDDKEIGKIVKLAADSRYDLATSAGDQIEGFISSVESFTADDYSIGGIQTTGRKRVTLDGLQATAGTGTCAVGDYVVASSNVTAKGTALSAPPKVCKATTQTGMYFAWRIVALEGTGAVGQVAVIERVS